MRPGSLSSSTSALLDAALAEGVMVGDSTEMKDDEEPGEDIETLEDGEPGEDLEPGEETEPGEDIETLEDGEPGEDLEPGEDTEPTEDTGPLPMLLAAVYALRGRGRPSLREEYLRSLLEPAAGTPPLRDELQRAVADLERRLPGLPAEPARAAALQSLLDELARGLLAAAERRFILDTARSSLELLEPAERDLYLGFAWHHDDFPGYRQGPNEARAEQMFAALTRLRPERRVNQGAAAVVRKSEFDGPMQAHVERALARVPEERGRRLHRDASTAYVQMRSAATAEGVTLSIRDAHRPSTVAQASAARADNPAAVASFSAHTLGLAVDLNMSHSGLSFLETTTRPFQNVVDMYKSPVHKWMFLRGETHGWFPYRPEPWHWEYNPPGFRERFRQREEAAGATVSREDAGSAEGANDPITAPRRPLAITGSVGRGGRNLAADVKAVQDRLLELHLLEQADAATERPPASGTAADSSLPRTIDAIETFQRHLGMPVNGLVDVVGATRTDLDRVILPPTAAELATVATERSAVRQSVSRGLTLTGAVGDTASGNAPEDVRAVQRRLADLGRLPASHHESPPPGATGAVPPSSLRATIAALRSFQADVRFWVSRRTITGAITPGVATPGDATATLLDRVSVYSMSLGPNQVSFHDHVVSGATRSEAGVMFVGTASPSAIPIADYQALGLTAGEAAALKLVSTHEGNFDAINTYDRALVSVGFIQFAGGRGLPRYLALLKARQPAKFRDLLQKLGIDVEFTVSGGSRTTPMMTIDSPRVAVLDPTTRSVLRATAAETAIRDDKRLTAALILSGRDRDVQRVQIEAAVRDYVRPALNATVSWAAGPGRARLGDLLRSQKGMAALFDRSIQEGVGAARRRFERIIQRLVRGSDPKAVPATRADVQTREGDVLAELERDVQAAADVVARITRARAALETLIQAASVADATVAGLLARPELSDVRRAVAEARSGLSAVVNVTLPPQVTGDRSVDTTLGTMNAALATEETRLALTPSPPSPAGLATALTDSSRALATVAGPLSTAPLFLARVQRIRRSTLDASLTEAV